MKLCLIGASRGVGRQLLLQALAAGHEIHAVARDPRAITTQHPALSVFRGDATEPQSLVPALQGCDVAISAIGVTGFRASMRPTTLYSNGIKGILTAMQEARVHRVAALSSTGVRTRAGMVHDPEWPWFYRRLIHRLLQETYLDQAKMEEALYASGQRVLLVRPAYLTDGPATGAYRTRPERAPARGWKISRADVAAYLLQRLGADDYQQDSIGIAY